MEKVEYFRRLKKEELCEEKCPIALEWSEWSCQCQRGSVLNQDKDLNPANIPICDCGTDRRYRVQACKKFNDKTPSCNIYHDQRYVSEEQDKTCKNYMFNTEKPESIFLGPEDVTRITVRDDLVLVYVRVRVRREIFGDTDSDCTAFNDISTPQSWRRQLRWFVERSRWNSLWTTK